MGPHDEKLSLFIYAAVSDFFFCNFIDLYCPTTVYHSDKITIITKIYC